MSDFKTKLTFSGSQGFHTRLGFKKDAEFAMTFSEGVGGHRPVYAGPYIVDPKFNDQMLATNGYIMSDDVLVHAILVHRVSNLQGGITVTIGVN